MHTFVMIVICSIFFYPNAQGIYFRNFPQDSESKHYDFTPKELQNNTLNIFSDSSETSINASENRTDEKHLESSSIQHDVNEVEEFNSTWFSSSSEPSTKNIPNNHSIWIETTPAGIVSNETSSTSPVLLFNNTSIATELTKSSVQSTSLVSSTNEETISSSSEDEEQEGVLRGMPSTTEITNTTTSQPGTMYQKVLELINDTYTLSILLPVAAGIVFASTIIVVIATCRCFKRQCRHRRLRKKTLPDSIKSLRPSDRARLLAESSDEEF